MAPPTVAQTLALAVSARGGTPGGNEDALITTVRQRLNGADVQAPEVTLRAWLSYGVAPLVGYLKTCHTDVATWQLDFLGDYVFELLEMVAYRTRIMKKYAEVIGSSYHWTEVERNLIAVVSGGDLVQPTGAPKSRRPAQTRANGPRWSANWSITLTIGVVSLLWMWYGPELFVSGRHRIQAFGAGVALLCSAFGYRWYGWTREDFARDSTVMEDDDDDESVAASDAAGSDVVSVPSPARDKDFAKEMAHMREELAALRIAQSPRPAPAAASGSAESPAPPAGTHLGDAQRREFDTLQAFAAGYQPPGPVSWAGADTLAQQPGAPQGPPGLPTGFQPAAGAPPGLPALPIWDDSQRQRTAAQAAQLLTGFAFFESNNAMDAHWASRFWSWVASSLGAGLTSELQALLSGHGFIGDATVSPPKGSFKKDLEAFRDTGAPLHGAGGAVPWAPAAMAAMQAPEQGVAWQHALPPDMKRGAPEIYRALRSAGSASTRDWLNLNFKGSRQSDQWIDLWNAATNVDYLIGRCASPAEEMRLLATNDFIETGMRRLAAYMYEGRSKDTTGARRMLAVQAPGANIDIAPEWMVAGATTYSKAEHQRDERVTAAARRGRGGGSGKGDGRGRGGARGRKGGGRGDQGPGPGRG